MTNLLCVAVWSCFCYFLFPYCSNLFDHLDQVSSLFLSFEPHRDKTNKMACAPSKGSDQPGHPPSLIRVFAVRLKKARVLSYLLGAQQRFWSDCADAQADLSLCWAHMPFCWFCHDAAHLFFLFISLSCIGHIPWLFLSTLLTLCSYNFY